MQSRFPGRFAIVLIVSALAQVGTAPSQASAGNSCEGSDARPGQASNEQLGRTTVCLVNRERRRRGLRVLRADNRLALAAWRHADDMVNHFYFAHNSRSGAKFTLRIVRSGYLRGTASWLAGENLAWGAGSTASPHSIVRGWMNSPGHRANILHSNFRDIGVGVIARAPIRVDYSVAATYVHDFGARR